LINEIRKAAKRISFAAMNLVTQSELFWHFRSHLAHQGHERLNQSVIGHFSFIVERKKITVPIFERFSGCLYSHKIIFECAAPLADNNHMTSIGIT